MQITEETVCAFDTYTSSRYEINKGKIRRLNPGAEKRADGEWLRLYALPEITVGNPAYLVLEPLSSWGVDDTIDYSYHAQDAVLTERFTSEVTGIEVQGEDGQA